MNRFYRALLAFLVLWVTAISMILVVMLQNQAHNEQSDAFRGRYLNMVWEGMDVIARELSATNIEISKLKQAKEKTELPDPSAFLIRPKGT